MNPSDGIRWPPRFHPDACPVHVCNELAMPIPADVVWACLIRAANWPAWYRNASRVRFLSGGGPDLALAASFRCTTFGVRIESTVQEFVPGERIAWDGRAVGIDVYHAWLIEKTTSGCRVLTEETQHGWLARLSHRLMPARMGRMHQVWLESLRDRATVGASLAG